MVGETKQSKILIATEDPQIILAFKLHREKFIILLKSGVFDLQSGKAEININNGVIQNVLLINQTYKRESKSDRIPI